MTRDVAIASVVSVILLLGGLFYLTSGRSGDDPFARCRTSKIAGGVAQIGGPFTLINEVGETVTDKDVITGPSLIYFGYTFCPDICPLDVARNAQTIEILEERGKIVTPIFISIDPSRDTPEVMADYTDYMHPRMIGLTGSEAQIKAASKAYRTFYQSHKSPDDADEFYLVDHSTFTYLTFPEHGFVEFFRRDMGPEELADRVQCFLDAS